MLYELSLFFTKGHGKIFGLFAMKRNSLNESAFNSLVEEKDHGPEQGSFTKKNYTSKYAALFLQLELTAPLTSL